MALAAVTSLLEIVEQDLQQPGPSLTLRNRETIVFLLSGKLRFLQAFLETSKMKTKLDREIRNVAADTQGKIGYKLRPGNFVYGIYQGLYPTLHQAVKDIEAIEIGILTAKTNTIMFSDALQDALEPQGLMIVGLDREIKMIIYQLASSHLMRSSLTPMRNRDIDNFLNAYEIPRSKLEVFPLVGEGGIGKTTLAKSVYEDPCIIASFHIRAWVVVSQVHNLREMLIGLLHCISPITSEISNKDDAQIAEQLCRSLMGQTYFILLDDVWTTTAWDAIRGCFPDNSSGSRILITTRFTEVAEYLSVDPYHLKYQTLDDRWKLFSWKVFGQSHFVPRESELIGTFSA